MASEQSASDPKPLGLATQGVVAALMTFAGAAHGEVGAAAAAGMIPYALAIATTIRDEWRRDQHGNVAVMATAAAIEAGWTADELREQTARSATARMLTGIASEAAAKTAWPPKVIALGRVLAAGLIAEADAVDVPQYALAAMTEMERLHLVMLQLLVNYRPQWDNTALKVEAIPCPAEQRTALTVTGEHRWDAGPRIWPAADVVEVRRQLRAVLAGVAGTLEQHGLAERRDRTPELLEQLSKDLMTARRQIEQMNISNQRLRLPMVAPVQVQNERSWAPTELGERVLGYYSEAADLALADPE